MGTPIVGRNASAYNTPVGSVGGYGSTPGGMWTPPMTGGTYRGVGRPRKYDIRR